ncbi:hypothetical protein EN5CB1_18830 [Tepidimicrobium xylanilyticum]|nr:hypothetical protein EN5CB1_18830 [Tepidimicrobium xylanilyticum]
MHVIAAKAVCFGEALTKEFKSYQEQVVNNAKALAASLKERGFRLVSGGTDNHIVLIDVSAKGLTGKKAEMMLEEVNITTNKNTIPFDPQKPTITSGIRIGTPAVTTRGMKEMEMHRIAELIEESLDENEDREVVKQKVLELCNEFPMCNKRLS